LGSGSAAMVFSSFLDNEPNGPRGDPVAPDRHPYDRDALAECRSTWIK
jgi:hypothetical protein